MLTLYTSGPRFGLPDASPFVTKVHVLLKMAGLAYDTKPANFAKAPKGKIPYLDDDGQIIADSTFIRWHLEEKHGAEFDIRLSQSQKAVAWAVEKMVEDHLYFAVVDARWTDDAAFDKGPRSFFDSVPAPLRPILMAYVRRQVRKSLRGHGMGRHARAEIVRLAAKDFEAIADILGDKPWLMGGEPCGADASVWAVVTGALCPFFESEVGRVGASHPNLVAYRDRGMQRWFADLQA